MRAYRQRQIWPHLAAAAPHDHLPVTGGSIGQGLPVAVGAALASPGRKVVALEADGSAMYTPQSLWTLAREGLDVVVVILANRRYRILEIEMRRTGAGAVGPRADRMIDLSRPAPDWIKLAAGFGVSGVRATTADEFIREFGAAMREPGPRLIEAVLDPGVRSSNATAPECAEHPAPRFGFGPNQAHGCHGSAERVC